MASPTLADAVTRICRKAGLDSSLIDVSLLTADMLPVSELLGYVIGRPTPAADVLKVLMQAYFFDACESDGKLRFIPRALAAGGTFGAVPTPGPGQHVIYLSAQAGSDSGAVSEGYAKRTGPGQGLCYFLNAGLGGSYPWLNVGDFALPAGFDASTIAEVWAIGGALHKTKNNTAILEAHVDVNGSTFIYWINTADPGQYLLSQKLSPTGGYGAPSAFPFSTVNFHVQLMASLTGLNPYADKVTAGFFLALVCDGPGPSGWADISQAMPGFPLVIPEDDLGLVQDKGKLLEQILQEQDLPKGVTVFHNDPSHDYQRGKQHKNRSVRVVKTKNKREYVFPLTLTRDDARKIAETILYLAWLERSSYQMNLARPFYMLVDPTDIVQFIYGSLTFQMRTVGNNLGQGFATGLNGVSEDLRNYLTKAIGAISAGFGGGTVRLLANTLLFLFDIPLLRDQDANPSGTGLYFGLSSTDAGWAGGILFESIDEATFTQDMIDAQPMSFGFAVNALEAPRSPWTWDEVNTLTITPAVGTPAGDSFLNVLSGSNVLVCGNGEIIQFRNAVQSGLNWILSGLLRGRRGTEWACGTHAIGEVIAAPQTGMQRLNRALSVIGQLRYYRAPTIGQTVSSVAAQEQQLTLAGNDRKPYAPAHILGSRPGGGSGDLEITWIRRTRIGWNSLSQHPMPLGEDSELYAVDIMNGGAVVRTISGLTSPTVNYLGSQQSADFGSHQSAVLIHVYQISAQIGRGFVGRAIV